MIPAADALDDERLIERRTMAGGHAFETLCGIRITGARAAAGAEARRLDDEMNLAGLRRAPRLSQDEAGHALQIMPGSVAAIEQRTDLDASTVRRSVEAMAGQFGIVARFASPSVTVDGSASLSTEG